MAFRTQKISQMTPKGANLEATDLIEVSTIESGSYVTRSITGQEIIDAAVGNVDWGDIGGTLSNQTDLQNALNGKENTITAGTTSQYFRGDKTFQTLDKAAVGLGNVDNTSDANKPISTATQTALNAKQNTLSLTTTGSSGASTLVGSTLNVPNYTLSGLGGVPTSRTLTINGVTQDLSANRTFTISTGITIGSTAIASGTVGRILFEGAGNVVQESSSLFWDATNNRLGIGTSSPAYNLDVNGSSRFQNNVDVILRGADISWDSKILNNYQWFFKAGIYTDYINFGFGSGTALRIQQNGNVLINTTTDAGFRLDVNGTARVSGALTASGSIISNGTIRVTATTASPSGNASFFVFDGAEGTNFAYDYGIATYRALAYNGSLVRFLTAGTERARFAITTGNFLINTTTDAGFRLDVNGTARVQTGTTGTTPVLTVTNTSSGNFTFLVNNSGTGNTNFGMQINGTTKASIGYSRSGDFLGFFVDGATPNYFLGQYNIDGSFQKNRTSDGNADFKVFNGGGTIVGAATLNASAQLQVDSTTKGFLPPRMTQAQRNAIASPAIGLEIYQTDATEGKYIYKSSGWTYIG